MLVGSTVLDEFQDVRKLKDLGVGRLIIMAGVALPPFRITEV